MYIGLLQFELRIRGSRSLKDKRRVIKSLKDKLHRHHMVSVAEVAAQDHQQLGVLALAMVSSSTAHIERSLDRIVAKLRSLHDAELGEMSRRVVAPDALAVSGEEWTDDALWTEDEVREAERLITEASRETGEAA